MSAALYLAQEVPSTAPGTVPGTALSVTILPYAPQFSTEDGLFCDIALDIGGAYLPFVRLGLVRYQAHAVEHLHLSHPIACDVQLLPERRIWVDKRSGVEQRTVVVVGPGFAVPDLGNTEDKQPVHKVNAMRLSLMKLHRQTQTWLQEEVYVERLEPEWDEARRMYRWRFDFTLPRPDDVQKERYLLAAEEYERLPQDQATGTYHDGEADFIEVAGERLSFACLLPISDP